MRWRRAPTTIPLSLLLVATPILAAFENDFSLYPTTAQPCLNDASKNSGCNGDTVQTMNTCLCGNGGNFVTNSASCIAKEDPDVLRIVYIIMSTACADSKTPIAVTEEDFLAAKASTGAGTQTSTSAIETTKAPQTTVYTTVIGGTTLTVTNTNTDPAGPSNTSKSGDTQAQGLTNGAKIAIGVGAGLGSVALIGVSLFMWRLRRSRQSHDESAPMLGAYNTMPSGFGDNQPGSQPNMPGLGVYQGQEWKGDNKPGWRPPSGFAPTPSSGVPDQTWQLSPHQNWDATQQAWGQHPQQAWPQPQQYDPPAHYAELPPQEAGVYELASMPAQTAPAPLNNAVEMPATQIHPDGGSQNPGQYSGASWGR